MLYGAVRCSVKLCAVLYGVVRCSTDLYGSVWICTVLVSVFCRIGSDIVPDVQYGAPPSAHSAVRSAASSYHFFNFSITKPEPRPSNAETRGFGSGGGTPWKFKPPLRSEPREKLTSWTRYLPTTKKRSGENCQERLARSWILENPFCTSTQQETSARHRRLNKQIIDVLSVIRN